VFLRVEAVWVEPSTDEPTSRETKGHCVANDIADNC
jgi:hypothetical protein